MKHNVLEAACTRYKMIDTLADLKREKLTLSDYDILYHTLIDLANSGKAITFNKAVADWLANNKLNVLPDNEGVNYIIFTK